MILGIMICLNGIKNGRIDFRKNIKKLLKNMTVKNTELMS